MRRRTVLRAAAGTLLATAGCAGSERPTQVAVVWSSGELDEFRKVLRGYPHPVNVISAGDDIPAFLTARHRAGTSPDVAIVSRPGLVTDYATRGWLSTLDDALAAPFPTEWGNLLRVDGRLYGAWVKAAYKSLFWYQPSTVDNPPATWDDLVSLIRGLGRNGGPAPLAIGAADGWVLTDWFENVLAGQAPEGFYDALAEGQAGWQEQPVKDALDRLAEVWSLPGTFLGGPGRALLTQWEESVIQVTSGQAAMVFEADFVQAVAQQYREPGRPDLATFRFPGLPGRGHPIVVGGDAAVVMGDSRRGTDLVGYLTRSDAFTPWIRDGGYLSFNSEVLPNTYPEQLSRDLIGEIQQRAPEVRFDLSDRLATPFGGEDGVGIWQLLQDFFGAVTAERADRAAAIDTTTRALARAAKANGQTR
jgi:ABC-type glycerol-3-phosphate transport system substrate-binding protein